MLEGLDKINWKNLQHAYGSANDVPDLIRALALEAPLGDIEDDELGFSFDNSASYKLSSSIFHQGTIFEATSYA